MSTRKLTATDRHWLERIANGTITAMEIPHDVGIALWADGLMYFDYSAPTATIHLSDAGRAALAAPSPEPPSDPGISATEMAVIAGMNAASGIVWDRSADPLTYVKGESCSRCGASGDYRVLPMHQIGGGMVMCSACWDELHPPLDTARLTTNWQDPESGEIMWTGKPTYGELRDALQALVDVLEGEGYRKLQPYYDLLARCQRD